jgi:F0F1-type ATP synthase beta subunit
VADTVRGFKEILEGKHDEVPEVNFYMKGSIEEIQETAEPAKAEEAKKPEPAKKPEEAKKSK